MIRSKNRILFILYYACKQNNTEKTKSDRSKEYDFLAIIF